MISQSKNQMFSIYSVLFLVIISILVVTYPAQPLSGLVTGTTEINVTQSTEITMEVSTLSFGTLAIGMQANTTSDNPVPFVIRNDGNVNVDISVRTNQSLFSGPGSGNNTNTFQFKAGNCSVAACGAAEASAFDWDNSAIVFTNFTLENQEVINSLGIAAAQDEAEVEIRINVPDEETAGNKTATITFTAEQES